MREMIASCLANQLKFRYVLMDSWFAARENFEFIMKKKRHFIAALKANRLAALSEADKQQGRYERIDRLSLPEKEAVHGWLKGYGKEVLLVRQVFTHKDGDTAILHLVCSDLSLDGEQVTALYQKRWNVEVFHKSLKSNAGLAKSPTQTVTTQNNHVFMSIVAVFKLECLKMQHHLNHFALRAKLWIKATQHAYEQLQALRTAYLWTPPVLQGEFQHSAYWLRLHVSMRPVIKRYIALAMMQFAHRDPYKVAASKAFTQIGFTRSRSYLFGISFSSPSQPWRVN